jgi:hypothetical protein
MQTQNKSPATRGAWTVDLRGSGAKVKAKPSTYTI